MKAKCCLWLHKYGRQKDGVGTCPVKLRVTFNGPKTHQYSILRTAPPKTTQEPISGVISLFNQGREVITGTRDVNQAVKAINKYMKCKGTGLGLERLPTCMFAGVLTLQP
jgi:phosphotransferase system IIB component